MNKLQLELLAAISRELGGMSLPVSYYSSIEFNLRRDNNQTALASANAKIEKARQERLAKKAARKNS